MERIRSKSILIFLLGLLLLPAPAHADLGRCSQPENSLNARRTSLLSACRSFEKYRAVSIPEDPTTPVDCTQYGVSPGRRVTTLEEALRLDCDVLEYREVPPGTDLAHNPVGDLALTCRALRARQNLSAVFLSEVPGLRGSREEKRQQRQDRLERARVCALQAFGSHYILNDPIHVQDAALENPIWGDWEEDLALLEDSALSADHQARAREAILQGDMTLETRSNPIDHRAFVQMINAVIADEHALHGTLPTATQEAAWSSEFLDCFGSRMLWTRIFSKQLMALAIGRGDQFTPSGDEAALNHWIHAQPDFSIEPASLFRKAYQLAEGDVLRAVRAIENVLSRYWTERDRGSISHVRKLRPITQTLGSEEDVFGTWYHLFGTLLHGLSTDIPFEARTVAEIESFGSLILSGFEPERQENRINRAGARVGSRLQRSLEREEWRQPESRSTEALQFENYIRVEADFERQFRRLQRQYNREQRRESRSR